MNGMLRIGVDVGGTNTDAALLRGSQVLATVKTGTTAEVTGGVAAAIRSVLGAGGVAAATLVVTVCYVLTNLVIDLTQALVDPRVALK